MNKVGPRKSPADKGQGKAESEEEPTLDSFVTKFGRYQLLFYSLAFAPSLLGGTEALHFSFTNAVPNLRCCNPHIEACNATTYNSSAFHQSPEKYWYTSSHSPGQACGYCASGGPNGTCTAANSTPCDSGVVYDDSLFPSSAARDFELFCGREALHQLVSTLFMVGIFISGPLSGYLADAYGRRKVFLAGGAMSILCYVATPLSPNFAVFGLFVVLDGFADNVCYLTAFIVLMEMVEGWPRTLCAIMAQTFFSMAYPFVGVAAMYVKSWPALYWLISSPALLYVAYIWLFPESIRWQVQNGKREGAAKELARLARMNRTEVPDGLLDQAFADAEDAARNSDDRAWLTFESGESFAAVFRHWSTARTTLVLFFTWAVASLAYYGLSLNTGDLPGNVYENFILSGIVEVPAYVITVPLMEYVGRRKPLVGFWLIGGAACIAAGLIPRSPSTTALIVVCAMVGKLCVAAAFAVIYMYTSEVFPTTVRQTATGLCSMFSRVGSMAAPQIHLLDLVGPAWLPIVVYGSFSVAAGVLDIWLPETLNKAMPENIQDAIDISEGRQPSSSLKHGGQPKDSVNLTQLPPKLR